MTRNEVAAWLQMLQAEGIGNDAARRLLAVFGLPQQVLAQSQSALQEVVSAHQAAALRQPQAQTQTLIETTWQWLQQGSSDVQRRILVLGIPTIRRCCWRWPTRRCCSMPWGKLIACAARSHALPW